MNAGLRPLIDAVSYCKLSEYSSAAPGPQASEKHKIEISVHLRGEAAALSAVNCRPQNL
jgi:hypothetical protein